MSIAAHFAMLAELLTLACIAKKGLWRRYPFFTWMLAGGLAQYAARQAMPALSTEVWIWSTPLLMLLQLAAAVEIARAWDRQFPARPRRLAAIAAAGLVAGGVPLAWVSGAPRSAGAWVLELQRDLAYGLAAALVVVVGVYAAPAAGRRLDGLRAHTGVMMLYWVATAVLWAAIALEPGWRAWAAPAYSALRAALLVGWCGLVKVDVLGEVRMNSAAAALERAAVERAASTN